MGGSPQDLEEVVGSFEGSVGRPSCRAPGGYFVSPGDDGVYHAAELGDLSGGVEAGEPPQSSEGGLMVFGEVEAVEFG